MCVFDKGLSDMVRMRRFGRMREGETEERCVEGVVSGRTDVSTAGAAVGVSKITASIARVGKDASAAD